MGRDALERLHRRHRPARLLVAAVASVACVAASIACSTFDDEAERTDGGVTEASTSNESGADRDNDSDATAGDGGCSSPSLVGLFDPASGRFMLFPRNEPSTPLEITIPSAATGRPIAGHWTKGLDTIGYRRPSGAVNFFLLSDNAAVATVTNVSFGDDNPSGLPFAGDWLGDDTSRVAVYIPELAAWFFRGADGDGGDVGLNYGIATDSGTPRPVAGRFAPTSKKDAMGIFDHALGQFFLKFTLSSGPADVVIQVAHSGKGVWPIAGDWDGCGKVTVGVYDDSQGTFYLLAENATGAAERVMPLDSVYKNRGYLPIVGRWKR